ncbi:MAG: hypothetical protein EA352_04890 [Gemmatimonadales bacterium]|nr:MAG: hypothetical protein EA352_04890 [Gemmatimonadales bacterium]
MGVGAPDPQTNPLFRARAPILRGERGLLLPLEATLGVEGLPSSGTGQTTLLTGRDAVRLHGAHFGPWTPARLRPLMGRENLMTRALAAGREVRFLNAVPEGWAQRVHSRRIPPVTLAARGAGLLDRHEEALRRGTALASGIVNRAWRRWPGVRDLPDPTPGEAGRTAARLSVGADLAVFAHFDTDLLGHRGTMEEAVRHVELVEAFLSGLLEALPAGGRVLVVSDHGNLEVLGGGHTRNPALGLWLEAGPAGGEPGGGDPGEGEPGGGDAGDGDPGGARGPALLPRSLLDIAPLVLGELGLHEPGVPKE